MESNPLTSLLGFWMMLQLFATLALLAGGIYLMFCLGRAASGLDRMANAMEDWVALQNQNTPNKNLPVRNPLAPPAGSTPGASTASISAASTEVAPPAPIAKPFTPASTQPQHEYSQPETINPYETQNI